MPSVEGQPRKRARSTMDQDSTSRFWYPWTDRIVSVEITSGVYIDRQLPDMYFGHTHALAAFCFFLNANSPLFMAFESKSG